MDGYTRFGAMIERVALGLTAACRRRRLATAGALLVGSAHGLLETLNTAFRRVRRSGIDEDLFDVVAGFEALAGGA